MRTSLIKVRSYVDAGKLGIKTGEGFYAYPSDSPA